MTKEVLTKLVIRFLTGGDNVADTLSKYHPAEVEKYIEMAFNSVIYQICLNAISYNDFGQLDAYCKSFSNVPVICDELRDEYYSILPVSIINLPKNRGIRFISPMKDQRNQFVDRENNASDIYDELEVGMMPDMITYYRENVKLFYDNRMTQELAENGVLQKLIPAYSEWSDEDELPIPGGKDMDIVRTVIELLSKKPNEDLSDNNNTVLKRN